MENTNEFDRYSNSWKNREKDGTSPHGYSENDINKFKMNTSKDFSNALRKSIWFDIGLKALLLAALFVLIVLFFGNKQLVVALLVAIAISVYFVVHELKIKEKFTSIDDLSSDLNTVLQQKIAFYSTSFPRLKWIMSFTNALFVWIGSMFYYYLKYGYYKLEDPQDYIVTFLMITLAFGISYLATSVQYTYYIRELKDCLTQLSDEQSSEMVVKQQAFRRRVIIIASLLAITIGALLFLYILLG